MTQFTIFDETSAPADSKPILRSVKARLGFIPNIMGELAASPSALDAYATLSAVFGRSGLTQIERNVVLLTTDFENNCGYCMAADSMIALNTGLDREIVVAIREGRVIQSDARLEALHQFTRAMVRERGLVERHDIDAFLRAGFTKANVLDVVTGVTLKTMSNYTNHIAETELDDSFAPMAWSKPLLQHAD